MGILKILLACAGGPGTLNSAPRQDFLPLKVKEHHLSLLFTQVSEPIGTALEGNPRDYGEYKHYFACYGQTLHFAHAL